MNKATFIEKLSGFKGDARLYRLDPALGGYEYVVVSAVVSLYSGPETYIFGANAAGKVLDWEDLPGSFRGSLDHVQALECAGYEVVA